MQKTVGLNQFEMLVEKVKKLKYFRKDCKWSLGKSISSYQKCNMLISATCFIFLKLQIN